MRNQNGSVILYIFIAIGLLAALTLSLVNTSSEDKTSARAAQISEALYTQAESIRSAVMECSVSYPDGGGDLDSDGDIDTDDNNNSPYPLSPTDANNPGGAAADSTLQYLKCPGAPSGEELVYGAARGRFLPNPPAGFTDWVYTNHSVNNNVYIRTYGDDSMATQLALENLVKRFGNCEAELDHGSCGTNCIKIFFIRDDCP